MGIACASAMLLDCKARGFDVHWDAQNPASRSLAEKWDTGWIVPIGRIRS